MFEPADQKKENYELSVGESVQVTLHRDQETLFTCTATEARYYQLSWEKLTDTASSSGRIKYNLYDNSMKKVIDIGKLAYGGNLRGIPLLAGESAAFGLSFEGYDEICDTLEVKVTLHEGSALPASGVSDGGMAYTFSQDGTLSLTGTFDCAQADDTSSLSMIGFYNYAIKRLEIGAGVTNFFELFYQDMAGKLLLAECEAIVPAEDHPQYVYNNGMILDRDQTMLFLWWNRNNTEDVRIPEGVKTISPLAFSPTLLFGLSGIDDYVGAIYDYQLPPMPNNVIAPSTLEAIGDAAFANCFTLNEVSGTDGLRYIGEGAFADCAALSEMPYSDKLEEIGAGAFNNCWTLQSARIPDSTITIGETAFSGCVFLKDVFIGNGVKVIERETFAGCPLLEQVVLGNALEEIADRAFTDCYMLRSLVLPASLQRLGIIGAVLDQGLFVRGEGTVLEGISLPFPTCHVEEFADEYSFPSSLQQAKLTEFDVDRMLGWLSIAAILHCIGGGEMMGLLAYNGNIEKGIQLERNVWSSFAAIEPATTPEESDFLPTIYGHVGSSSQAFAEENSYPFVDISETIASGDCGDDAHWTLNGLGTLTISGTGDMWDYTIEDLTNGNVPEYYDYEAQITAVVVENGITSIGEDVFAGLPIQSLSISDSVVEIGPAAFSNCFYMKEVSLPDSVTVIGENAFEYCKSLRQVALPEGLTAIETGLFIGCINLTEITIPASVRSIGAAAFLSCDFLQQAKIHSPDCVFVDEVVMGDQTMFDVAQYAFPEATVIYGRPGSTSETYAQTYDRQFVNHYTAAETKAATCMEAGVMTYTCSCGDTYTEEIPTLEHHYTTETIASDCKTHGYTRTYCTVGGEEIERTELPLAAHTPGASVKENEVEATTERGGSYDEVVRCTVCGTEMSRTAKTTDPLPKQDDEGNQPAKKLNFFQRIIEWIRNIIRRLFGRK